MPTEQNKKKANSALDQWLSRKKDKAVPKGIPPMPKGQLAPLSAGQKRLWLLQQLYPDNPFYQYAHTYRFKGILDIEKLLHSFQQVMDRHHILRTCFREEEAQVHQKIGEMELEHTIKDLRAMPLAEREAQAQNTLLEAALQPFDLSEGPLLRLLLLQMDDDETLLLLSMHHIIGDRWSLQLLNEEWAACYQSQVSDQATKLMPLAIQYADYAHWQQSMEVDTKGLDYWLQQLSGELPQLMLPSDRPRPLRPNFKGGIATKRLSTSLSNQIRALCKQLNCTPYVLLLAAYKLLLYRYSGQTDLLVGTPFTNRDQLALEKLIGFFNETLVLRSQLSDEMPFKALVEQLRQTTMDAFAHKNTPFDVLVKRLKPERHGSSNPLFQVMFLYNKALPVPAFAEGVQLEEDMLDLGVSKFDLTLFVNDHADYLEATFEYASELFDAERIEGMLGHFENILEGVVETPELPLAQVTLLGTVERRRLLEEWNATAIDIPDYKLIHKYIEEQALANKEQAAVIFGEEQLTYEELNQRANAVAHALVEKGLKPDQVVGLYAPRSLNLMVGILAILKAGGAYLPLDPTYPAERIEFMIKDAEVPLILTQSDLEAELPASEAQVLSMESAIETFADQGQTAPTTILQTDNPLAYIIYTSGSTGKPKGVSISHRNLIHSTFARFHFYPQQVDRFLLLSSFAFDSSIVGIFWTMCSGGTLLLPPRRIEQDISQLSALMAKHRISHTLMLPSLYKLLLEYAEPQALKSLTTVMVAGEACPPAVVRQHFDCLPHAGLYNEYGPTEASVWCIAHRLQVGDAEGMVPIGRAIPNAKVYLLDRQMQAVPIGVAGELYIGGDGIAQGYLKRPELTAERFLSNPFTEGKGDRLYRTGDLARYRRDGVIEFLGRVDQQVKIRGFRVEPDEISAVLMKYEGVREALVVADGAAQRLLGYASGEGGLEAADLRRFLKSRLPDYMVPSAIVVLDEFPRLPNGKINRTKLPAVEQSQRSAEQMYTAANTEIEAKLVAIWEDILKTKPIGIHDNFFEIGGDSILSIAIIAKARQEELIMAPNQLFEHQTIAELAAHAEQEEGEELVVVEEEQVLEFPLSYLQQAFLFHSLYQSSDQGLLQLEFTLKGEIDIEIMQRAWQEVVVRHAVLRTGIQWEGIEQAIQKVEEDGELPWTILDWQTKSIADQHLLLERLKAKDQETAFDLTKAPISRMTLIQLEKEESLLLWTCHHILLDGWSAGIILKEALEYYEAAQNSQALQKKAIPTYASYLAWQAQQDAATAQNYWTDRFSGYQKPDFPAATTASSFHTTSIQLSLDESEALKQYSRQHRSTLNSVVQSLWALLLGQYFQRDDIVFGTTVSGRFSAFPAIEQMTGLFMNVLPSRYQLQPEKTFADWLQATQQEQVEARRYEEVSLDQITKWLDWPTHIDFFDSLFVFGNFLKDGLQVGSLSVDKFVGGFSSTYPLTVRVNPLAALEINFRYDQSRISAERIEWLSENFLVLLRGIKQLSTESNLQELSQMIQAFTGKEERRQEAISLEEPSTYFAPRTASEVQLCTIWAALFNRKVGVKDHFFEIGGRSLLALQLFAQIEQQMEVQLSPVSILQHPTIESLAKLIDGEENLSSSSIVALRSVGTRQPLFCIHSGGAHVFFYRDLANRLEEDQPVYAIQPAGLDGEMPFHGSIEEMAAVYIEEMKAVQPEGPYALLGTCFSNAVALEMGHQLRRIGEEVALLAIIDSGPAHLGGAPPNGERQTLRRFAEMLKQGDWSRIKKKISSRFRRQPKAEVATATEPERKLKTMIDSLNAVYAKYHWQPFEGEIHLIRSSEFNDRKDKRFHLRQWEALAKGGLEVSVVPGHHISLFEEPEVVGLAEQIGGLIKKLSSEVERR